MPFPRLRFRHALLLYIICMCQAREVQVKRDAEASAVSGAPSVHLAPVFMGYIGCAHPRVPAAQLQQPYVWACNIMGLNWKACLPRGNPPVLRLFLGLLGTETRARK